MSKKASPTVVGGFVLGAVMLTVAAVLLFGGGKLFQKRQQAVLFFSGSVKGLGVGAPVVYNGVAIGEVSEVLMEMDLQAYTVRIPVVVEFDPARMRLVRGNRKTPRENLEQWITRGLRGQLEMQSFVTGQLMVSLEFRPETPVKLVGGGYRHLIEIPTIPTPVEELSQAVASLPLKQIVEETSDALTGISKVVNSPEIHRSLASIERTLAGVDALVQEVSKEAKPLFARVNGTLGDVQGTVGDARTLIRRVDGRVDPLANSTEETLRSVQAALVRVDPAVAAFHETVADAGRLVRNTDENLQPALKKIGEASGSAATALEQVTATLGSLRVDSPLGYDLEKTLRELSAASRSLRILSEYLEQRPDALLRGKTQMGGD